MQRFQSDGERSLQLRSALVRIVGLTVIGVFGSGAIVSCASERSVGPVPSQVRLTRSAAVVGHVSVFDTLVNGVERTAISETTAPFEEQVGLRGVSVSLPGTKYRIQIAVLARTTPSASNAIASVTESETRVDRADSMGRKHSFVVLQYGDGGPVTRIEHRVDGKLLAITAFGWERVAGGWSLKYQRITAYQSEQELRTITVVVNQHNNVVATVKFSVRSSLLDLGRLFWPATAEAKSLHGVRLTAEDEDAGCLSEGIALVGAGVLMGSMCIVGGPANPFCLVAIAGYVYASNAWISCRQQPE